MRKTVVLRFWSSMNARHRDPSRSSLPPYCPWYSTVSSFMNIFFLIISKG